MVVSFSIINNYQLNFRLFQSYRDTLSVFDKYYDWIRVHYFISISQLHIHSYLSLVSSAGRLELARLRYMAGVGNSVLRELNSIGSFIVFPEKLEMARLNPIPGGLWKVRFWAGGGLFGPFRYQKPHIGATNGKRCLKGRWNIYNFYIKHFRLRSILKSPEVINDKMFWNYLLI